MYETKARVIVLSGEVQALRFAIGRILQTLDNSQQEFLREALVPSGEVGNSLVVEMAAETYESETEQQIFVTSYFNVLNGFRNTVK